MINEAIKAHFAKTPETKETRLRPYEKRDIEIITLACEVFLPELPQYKDIKVDADRIKYLLEHNYGNSGYFQSWVLVDENDLPVGGGAGYCTAGMFTWDLIATDVFLFVLPQWRTLTNVNKLIAAYRAWGQARGAVIIQASQTGGYKIDLMDKLMHRNGFTNVGPNYHYRRK